MDTRPIKMNDSHVASMTPANLVAERFIVVVTDSLTFGGEAGEGVVAVTAVDEDGPISLCCEEDAFAIDIVGGSRRYEASKLVSFSTVECE